MRAERLLQVINDVLADIRRLRLNSRLLRLEKALAAQAANPTEDNQNAVASTREELRRALTQSRFNGYAVSLNQIVQEVGAEDLLGHRLSSRIDGAFEGNALTPAIVLSRVRQAHADLKQLQKQSVRYASALKYFKISQDELQAGEFEITVAIPGAAVDCELGKFGRETVKIDRMIGVFSEIATGSRESFRIRAIASSDLTVFLHSAPAVAALVATSVERVATLYERVLSIIKLHREMKQKDLPADVLKPMKDHIDKAVKLGLENIAKKLEQEYFTKMDPGRKQEIRKELRHALEDLATRLDRGYTFDVRGEPPDRSADTQNQSDRAKARDAYKIVDQARPKLQQFHAEEEPILGLPGPSRDTGEDTEGEGQDDEKPKE
jgi:hypothetical protein